MSRRRPHGAALIVLALLAGLLGLLPPSAVAAGGGGTSLTVQLETGSTPVTWGDDATFAVGTNQATWEGALQIWRIDPDDSRTIVATLDDVGTVTVDTRTLPVGDLRFVAVAIAAERTAESVVRYLTVSPRPTTTTFLDRASPPLGSFRVQVESGDADLVPTGGVHVTGGPLDVVVPLDDHGVAVVEGVIPGTFQMHASYLCEGPYACSRADASLRVDKFPSEVRGEITPSTVRPGAPVSVEVWLEGRVDYPATGEWWLFAARSDGTVEPVTEGFHEDGEPFRVDLTSWAATHPGTWTIQLDYGGNPWTKGFWKAADLGTLTVVDGRAPTETSVEPPATGVPVGGTVTVRVTAATGLPAGAVTLRANEDGAVLATAEATQGVAVLQLPASLDPGVHQVWAEYAGSDTHRPSLSELVALHVHPRVVDEPVPTGPSGPPAPPPTPTVTKASSAITGTVVGKRRTAVLSVAVASDLPVTGTVQVRDGHRLVRTVALRDGRARITLKKLRTGKHRLTVTFVGSTTVSPSQRTWRVRVR